MKVKVLEYKQPLPKTVPETKISYSDHEAVAAKILIETRKKGIDSLDSCSSKFEKTNEKSYADTLGEGIEVLEQILKRLRTDKSAYFVSFSSLQRLNSDSRYEFGFIEFCFFYSVQVMAFLLTIPLFFLIDIYPPYGMGVLFLFAKMLFSGVVIFFIFMATMWNSIERSGILSAKLSMEMARTAIAHYDNRPFINDNTCS